MRSFYHDVVQLQVMLCLLIYITQFIECDNYIYLLSIIKNRKKMVFPLKCLIFTSCCQGVAKSLHKECLAKMEPSKAGFSFLNSLPYLLIWFVTVKFNSYVSAKNNQILICNAVSLSIRNSKEHKDSSFPCSPSL